MKTELAVRSSSFETYKIFKSDVEKLGFRYEHNFVPFEELSMERTSCLFFSRSWHSTNDFMFSFSNPSDDKVIIDIDYADGYVRGIQAATKLYSNRSKVPVSIKEIAAWKNCAVADLQIVFDE